MNLSRRAVLAAALGSLAAMAGGCARHADPATGGGKRPMRVGLLWTRTGAKLEVAESNRFEQGLRIGLSWATSRTNQIGVRKITTLKADDRRDPAVAAAAAEDLIDRGCRVVVGGFTAPVALRLAEVAERRGVLFIAAMSTADELTGINRHTFRDGPSVTQLLTAAKAYVRSGHRLAVLAADRATAAKAASALGAATTIVAPADLSSIGRRIGAARVDQIYVDWPVVTPRLWDAIPAGVEPITVLGARATWPAYGAAAGSLQFVTAYVDGAASNTAYQMLHGAIANRHTDTGHAEGYAAAQMIVRALQYGPENVDDMIGALEGAELGGLKPGLTIRAPDHLLEQPLWGGRLTWTGAAGVVTAVVGRQFQPAETATPPGRPTLGR